MDTMKIYLSSRIRASSLVEVLVALTVITLVLGLSGTALVRLISAGPSTGFFLQRELEAMALREKTQLGENPRHAVLADSIPVSIEWLPYGQDERLRLLQITVIRHGSEGPVYREVVERSMGHDQ